MKNCFNCVYWDHKHEVCAILRQSHNTDIRVNNPGGGCCKYHVSTEKEDEK